MKTLLISVALVFSSAVSAEITLQEYEESRSDERMEIYVNGLYYGMFYSNAFQSIKERELIYCPEKNLKSTPMEIIDAYIADGKIPMQADDPLGMILLAALVARYPCP